MSLQPVVYIVDDDALVLHTLQNVFRFAGFRVFCYQCPITFLESVLPHDNACLILDISMPGMTGLELQEQLSQRHVFLPIVIYSGNADVPMAVRAMVGGAFTLVEKPCSNDLLVETVRKAIKAYHEKQAVVSRTESARQRFSTLSKREQEVALLVAQGHRSSTIAEKLNISRRTAETHRSNILDKLQLSSTAALIELVILHEMHVAG